MVDIKILLVEDDAIEALDIKRTLESFGYSVPYVASRGEEAVTKALEIIPDLILMDIILKGQQDGIDVASEIKNLNIPVIYLTAHSEELTVQKAKLTEPYGYLIKPYDIIELKCTIDFALFKSNQEKKLRESEENFRAMAENASEGILIAVDDGTHAYANQMAAEITGYTTKKLLKKSITDLAHSEEVKKLMERFKARMSGEAIPSTYETRIVRKDGTIVPIEFKAAKTVWKGQQAVMVLFSDITERKLAENEQIRLNRHLRAISNCNQAMLRAVDEQTLLSEVCSIICDEAGYRLAWVGYAEHDEAKTIRPVAWAGYDSGYIAHARLSWSGDTERGRGPAGMVIRSGELVYVQDFKTDPLMAPWRESALERGYRSGIALPLHDKKGNTFGALLIYSEKPNAINPDEIWLMEELAGNLAYGIMSLREQEDLKNTKESLRHESAQLLFKNTVLEAQLESTIDGILVVDENEKIILFNKRFGEILDIPQNVLDLQDDKKLLEYSITDLKDPESFFEVMEYLKVHKNEKSWDQFEFKDGRIFDRYSSPLLSESGHYYGRIWYIRDVTELIKAEKALKDSEERMRLTLEATQIGLWDWDVKNDEWYASSIYYSMLGYEPQSGPGDRRAWLERVHPNDRAMVKEKIDNVLVQNFNSYEYEARLRHADGNYRWVHVAGFSIERGPDGKATRMLGIRVDITERKKAEDAILQAKEEWEHTFDAVPDLIAILDTDYHVIRANKAMADRLGVGPEEAVGVTCYEVVHGLNGPPSFCPHCKLLKNGQEHTAEVHEDRIGGDFIVSVSPLFDSEEKLMGSVHVARDITDRKKAEDEVIKSLKEKEVLLSEIHHRVKNNMQIISSLLNLQTQFVTADETLDVLHESQDRVKAMANIYEKLYLSEDLTKINFKNYIQSLVQGLFYSHTIKEGQITPLIEIEDIMLNIETAVPCGLIISELVSNSLKHAFPDERKGEVQVSLQRCDDKYELLISDNGVGFPENIDFKNTNTLGLQLVNNLIKQIEGEITLNVSHGTEFKITFKELEYAERI